MRAVGRPMVVVCLVLVGSAGGAGAVTDAERCAAYQLAATGQRISTKLHCRAWAKLTGTEVDPACLDKAEKRFLLQLQNGGAGCAEPDDVVSLGAAADAQMSAVVADIEPAPPALPDLTGHWRTETRVAVNQDGPVIGCEFYQSRPCPTPDFFLLVACETDIVQTGNELRFESTCSTPPGSPLTLSPFTQSATGSVEPLTGEWLLAGTVFVPGLGAYEYQGEGVFSPDGRAQTGFTTAGVSGAGGTVLWLASTTGARVE